MADPAPRILVFGDVIDDVIVTPLQPVRSDTDTPARIERRPGGSAANVACWLGALGANVDFVGHVGQEDVDHHEKLFQAAGVSAYLIGHEDLPTGTIIVLLDPEQHSRTMLTERGANMLTGPRDVTDSLLEGVDHVHFTGYSIFAGTPADEFQDLISRAHAAGATTSLDPGSAGFIADHGLEHFLAAASGVDILLPNADEGTALTALIDPAEIVRALSESFPLVALTLGRSGAMGLERGQEPVAIPIMKVEPIDTTGAGDAFSAGFLNSWLRHGDAVGAGSDGVAASARAITVVGGRPE